MGFSFDEAFGVHADAMTLRARRAELLAANLANADTPRFKARDMDFNSALAAAKGQGSATRLQVTHAGHISGAEQGVGGELMYRVPQQPSLDGNSVEPQVEMAEFMRNAVSYQVSARFVSGKIKTLMTAIKGQ